MRIPDKVAFNKNGIIKEVYGVKKRHTPFVLVVLGSIFILFFVFNLGRYTENIRLQNLGLINMEINQ